ncbi:hypothetical protein DERP_011961, partial [Dermatophagoides pteronyssinus]
VVFSTKNHYHHHLI